MTELSISETQKTVKLCPTCGGYVDRTKKPRKKYCSLSCYISSKGDGVRTPIRCALTNMLQRCYNPKHPEFVHYGARSINVCEEWRSNPDAFVEWSMKNGWAPGLSIDRIDNDGSYGPNNCRWTTTKRQNRNKRDNVIVEAFGETKTATDWAEDPRCLVSRRVLYHRLGKGMSPEVAMTDYRKHGGMPFGMSDEDALTAYRRMANGESTRRLSVEFGVSDVTLQKLANGKSYKHLQLRPLR